MKQKDVGDKSKSKKGKEDIKPKKNLTDEQQYDKYRELLNEQEKKHSSRAHSREELVVLALLAEKCNLHGGKRFPQHYKYRLH